MVNPIGRIKDLFGVSKPQLSEVNENGDYERLYKSYTNEKSQWSGLEVSALKACTMDQLLAHADQSHQGWESIAITLNNVTTFIDKDPEGNPRVFIPDAAKEHWGDKLSGLNTGVWHQQETPAVSDFIDYLLSHCLSTVSKKRRDEEHEVQGVGEHRTGSAMNSEPRQAPATSATNEIVDKEEQLAQSLKNIDGILGSRFHDNMENASGKPSHQESRPYAPSSSAKATIQVK
jgi:hypothetical protein